MFLSVFINFLTLSIVILTIIYDGKFIDDGRKKKIRFVNQIKKINRLGICIIVISLFLGLTNIYINASTQNENDNRYKADTIASNKIIKDLRNKREIDSIEINYLISISEINVLKSDSIKNTIINTSIKALHEQQNIIERDKENTFFHFQNEVFNDLQSLIYTFDVKSITKFGESDYFINNRLSNIYIKKYQSVSNSRIIINHLMKTETDIDTFNKYAEEITQNEKGATKEMLIRQLLRYRTDIFQDLASIYQWIFYKSTYKSYESSNFSKIPPISDFIMNEDSLKYLIINNYVPSEKYWEDKKH